eukprot:TRINITY_DN24062_c0_g1_i1.p1 TRINITY_DN24062_c0_g1~~TRINITY_DN24062_c0_g1_i1.p1  ORF type:complete len:380 (+),score=78.92 TRINITY_DN24062_c0_g1_i1:121-1260(+)
MKAIVLLALVAGASAVVSDFETFKSRFGRVYADREEHDRRKAIFESRAEAIARHNADPSQTYKRTVNSFTDRFDSELARSRGLDRSLLYYQREHPAYVVPKGRREVPQAMLKEDISGLPTAVDWRSKVPSVVTPVKNQGECGSCWTFASTETIESQWAIRTGRMQELSEQFILDCTPNPNQCGGTGGCAGGTAELAYSRLHELNGIPSEWTYPYISGTGTAGTCHGLPLKPENPHHGGPMAAANISGHVALPTNSYAAVLRAIATVGPLAVSVDAADWHDYAGGVFDGGNHTNPTLDHLVQLVGYGTDEASGKDFWLIRNSWTPEWGEGGYIRLLRSSGDPPCGLDVNPLDGNGCKGGPPTVKVCGQNGVLYDAVYPIV